jgi:hypothetical protein
VTNQPAPPAAAGRGRPSSRLRTALPIIVLGLAFLGSIGYILWVVREVQDEQIKDLSLGFAALGLTFAATAIGCLFAMWRASSRAEGGRSFGLALVGGLAGLAAIGSFSVMALLTMLLNS